MPLKKKTKKKKKKGFPLWGVENEVIYVLFLPADAIFRDISRNVIAVRSAGWKSAIKRRRNKLVVRSYESYEKISLIQRLFIYPSSIYRENRTKKMKPLRCVDITGIAFIGMFFCVGFMEATGQAVITSTTYPGSDIEISNFIMRVYNNGCKCIKYDCGCCQHVQWDVVSMDGKLCLNASYLEKDFGISLTVTYNDFAIFNETVSARNPPPICFGEDVIDAIEVEACLRIYDIRIETNNFHACFEISGKIMKLTITKIRLGCIQTKLSNKIGYIKNNLSPLFLKKTEIDTLPSVIMV